MEPLLKRQNGGVNRVLHPVVHDKVIAVHYEAETSVELG
jgi:hypothetical protein